MITSKDNKKIKYIRSLSSLKNRKKHRQFTVEGLKNIEMARHAGCVDYVVTTSSSVDGMLVDESVMKSIVSTSSTVSSLAVCNFFEIKSSYDKVLILDDVQDPGNLGTLIRSALAFGFDTVVCSHNCADFTSSKVIRSSGGAFFYLNVFNADICTFIKNSPNPTIGTFIDGETSITRLPKLNLVIGNEGNGISEEVRELCDIKYRIDIDSRLDSLNAAVAGSILMHQLGGNYDF